MRARIVVVILIFASATGLAVLSNRAKAARTGQPAAASFTLPRPETTAARARLSHPIVLIGLDGADWQIIDPLIAQGRLPNIERLKKRSAWGHMRSSEPILSPLLWTTAATGKPPDEHGIIDFLIPDAMTGRRVPITSRERRVRALWNIFSERGLTADVVAWWATWPAESVKGRIVSDRVAYSLFDVEAARAGLTYPEGLWQEIRREVVTDDAIGYERVARFTDISRGEFDAARRRARENPTTAYREPVNHLTKILAAADTYQKITLRLLSDGQPDLLAVYYQGIDEVSHRFAHYMAPKMSFVSDEDLRRYRRTVEEYYTHQDELLGQLLARVSGESTIIVMSDHGFANGAARPTDGPADIEGKPGKWHRLYGIVMVAGAGITPAPLDTATLFDIAPTVLTLAGLPQASDMKGVPLLATPDGGKYDRIATYEPSGVPDAPRNATAVVPPSDEIDEELLRNLESLGYIGGSSSPKSAATAQVAVRGPVPETVTAHTNLASLLVQKGDLAGAETELRAALELKGSYFPALMTLSQVLVRQGKVEEALSATRRAVATSSDAEDPSYVQLALLAARAGQTAQAANFLEALRSRRPGAAGIDIALGVLAEKEDGPQAYQEAQRRYLTALSLAPASPEAMGRLFTLKRATGEEAELEPLVRAALAVNDASVLHHNWIGLILSRKGDATGAEREFLRALSLAPDFGGTMANLGSLYGREGRLEEAVTILRRALRIEPSNLEARVNLGGALAKLGRLDEAIGSLEEARRLGMRSPELCNAIGLAYAEKGRTREAIDALKESLTLSPRQPQVEALLSELTRPT